MALEILFLFFFLPVKDSIQDHQLQPCWLYAAHPWKAQIPVAASCEVLSLHKQEQELPLPLKQYFGYLKVSLNISEAQGWLHISSNFVHYI